MMTPARILLRFLFIVSLCLIWALPSFAAEPQELLISAAASLKNVLGAVGKKFEEKNPGTKVVFNFGASGALVNQITGGAPVDLFFAADIRDVEKLGEARLLASGSPQAWVRNELVFITPGTGSLRASSAADLVKPEWKKIAMGNPKTVPAGRYADETLRAENVADGLKERLVLCENVRQVLDYVIRGEVDGGFVYRTDAKTAKNGELKELFAVPSGKHAPIVYGFGKLTAAKQPQLADTFLAFLLLPETMSILTDAGFQPPKAE